MGFLRDEFKDILKDKYGITKETSHHNWEYVYESVLVALEDYVIEAIPNKSILTNIEKE